MFGIPEWAIGTGFISFMFFAGIGLMYRFMPPDARRHRLERHEQKRLRALGMIGALSHDPGALDDIQDRLGHLEQLEPRLAEVEERLDFAERLLARQADEQKLPGASQIGTRDAETDP
jgi:hypothetical protein